MQNPHENVPLRSIEEIPEPYRCLFTAYPSLNRVQSTVFDDLLHSTSSVVVTAPTGSGKTLLFELAIVKLLLDSPDPSTVKAVYVAPVKALCNERFQDWNPRFSSVGISCVKVTGDSDDNTFLDDYNLILTTPEKWDALTRRWRDNVSFVQNVKLLMIDEVHLLRDSRRGPVLETIVCRMKTMARTLKLSTELRFIAVSATIYNIEDLAAWLGSDRNPAKFHRFGNEIRPVALKRIVKGYMQAKSQSPFLFDIHLSYKLKPILLEFTHGKPALIFCSTRRGVVQTCKVLFEQLCFQFSQMQLGVLNEVAAQLSDAKLRELIVAGIGYHHAGMTAGDRSLVQDVFMRGSLPVLVATSTLAMGVNLPAHLVVIKSTVQYNAGRVEEYPESSVLQMVGRAGRPQFDTFATAVIMTSADKIHRYENMLDCKEVLESSLHLQLAEHLNSEIVLHTICDLGFAMEWLRCTFLYQRAFKNPKFYGLGNSARIEKDLETMVLREINALNQADLVQLNENGIDITPTTNGRLMSHFYINFHTFCLFGKVGETATVMDLLGILSEATELNEIQLRVTERKTLNELNVSKLQETIRFPLPGKISTSVMKINCLTQACLCCLPIPDPSLQQESLRIVSILERTTRCVAEYMSRRGKYCPYLSAVLLAKCLHARLWENTVFVARQLERIGVTLGAALVAAGKTSFSALEQSHPLELERILNRGPPMGNMIIDQVRHLPRYTLRVDVLRGEGSSRLVSINVALENAEVLAVHNTAGDRHGASLIVGDSNNRLLHQRRVVDSTLLSGPVTANVALKLPLPRKIFVHIISEQWVGLDVVRDVMIDPLADLVVNLNCHLLVQPAPPPKSAKKSKASGPALPERPKPDNAKKETHVAKKQKLDEVVQSPALRKNASSALNAKISVCAPSPRLNTSSVQRPVQAAMNSTTSKSFNENSAIPRSNYLSSTIHTNPVKKTPTNVDDLMQKVKNVGECCFDLDPDWSDEEVATVEDVEMMLSTTSTEKGNTSGDSGIGTTPRLAAQNRNDKSVRFQAADVEPVTGEDVEMMLSTTSTEKGNTTGDSGISTTPRPAALNRNEKAVRFQATALEHKKTFGQTAGKCGNQYNPPSTLLSNKFLDDPNSLEVQISPKPTDAAKKTREGFAKKLANDGNQKMLPVRPNYQSFTQPKYDPVWSSRTSLNDEDKNWAVEKDDGPDGNVGFNEKSLDDSKCTDNLLESIDMESFAAILSAKVVPQAEEIRNKPDFVPQTEETQNKAVFSHVGMAEKEQQPKRNIYGTTSFRYDPPMTSQLFKSPAKLQLEDTNTQNPLPPPFPRNLSKFSSLLYNPNVDQRKKNSVVAESSFDGLRSQFFRDPMETEMTYKGHPSGGYTPTGLRPTFSELHRNEGSGSKVPNVERPQGAFFQSERRPTFGDFCQFGDFEKKPDNAYFQAERNLIFGNSFKPGNLENKMPNADFVPDEDSNESFAELQYSESPPFDFEPAIAPAADSSILYGSTKEIRLERSPSPELINLEHSLEQEPFQTVHPWEVASQNYCLTPLMLLCEETSENKENEPVFLPPQKIPDKNNDACEKIRSCFDVMPDDLVEPSAISQPYNPPNGLLGMKHLFAAAQSSTVEASKSRSRPDPSEYFPKARKDVNYDEVLAVLRAAKAKFVEDRKLQLKF